MDIFSELDNKVNSVINNIDNMIINSMVAEESAIIDLNVSQLEEGINKQGDIVGEYESQGYAIFKQLIGSKAPLGVVDTKMEGDFHEKFYAEAYFGSSMEVSGLFINSSDEKTNKLESKYSGLFGIAPANIPELQGLTLDETINQVKHEIIK